MKVSYNSNTFVYCLIAMLLALCYHFDLKVYFWFGSIIFGIRLLWVLLLSSFVNLTKLYIEYHHNNRNIVYGNESIETCKEKAALTIIVVIMIFLALIFMSCLQFCTLIGMFFPLVIMGLVASSAIALVLCASNSEKVSFVLNAIKYKLNKGEKK